MAAPDSFSARRSSYSFCKFNQNSALVPKKCADAETALALIDSYQVTCAQWVPTHFVRMLRLTPETRARYDVSSLRTAIHAAAPWPVEVKEQMIQWWGPVLFEYYAGTEGNGMTAISATDWLRKKGSVGKAVYGELRICDEAGEPVAANVEGTVPRGYADDSGAYPGRDLQQPGTTGKPGRAHGPV